MGNENRLVPERLVVTIIVNDNIFLATNRGFREFCYEDLEMIGDSVGWVAFEEGDIDE